MALFRAGRWGALVVIILLTWAPAAAWAVLLVGTNGTSLTRFDSSTPGTLTTVQVTGMQAGEDLVPSNYLESAIVGMVNPGDYTAVVTGVNGGTGVGLVEVYDLSPNINSRLANIATRGLVQTGDNVLIAGTIVIGQSSQKVIIRAIGPSLQLAGKMENPTLELRDNNGAVLAANDNWRSTQEGEIIATTIPPTNDLESAIVHTLPPASYTAILRGANDTTGIGVIEVYALN